MFCIKCGEKIDNSKFCGRCGEIFIGNNKNLVEDDSNEIFTRDKVDIFLLKEINLISNQMMLKGLGFIILGGLITAVTYYMADEGDTYFVFWGLSLYGGYVLIKGVYYKIYPQKLIEETQKNKL